MFNPVPTSVPPISISQINISESAEGPRHLRVDDIDQNGTLDVLTAGVYDNRNKVLLFFQNPNGSWSQLTLNNDQNIGTIGVGSGDIDGDGIPDSKDEKPREAKKKKSKSKEDDLARIADKKESIDFKTLGTASEDDKDDLKNIKGIGPFLEQKLNALGIYTYKQISNMTPELEDQVNEAIEFFPGRIKRDNWVKQAKDLK